MTPRQLAKLIEQWAAVANATAELVEQVPPPAAVIAAGDNPMALHDMITRFRRALSNADSAAFTLFHLLDLATRPPPKMGHIVDFEALGITEEEFNLVLEHRKESKHGKN